MLVLSRRVNEKLLIGNDIQIMITEIRGDKVRLAVTCPKDIRVDREEVRAKIDAANTCSKS